MKKKKKEKKKQWINDIDDEDIFAEEDVKETNVADSDKDLSALEFLFSIENWRVDLHFVTSWSGEIPLRVSCHNDAS